jgi:dipeptidyl aminopeptidase/acylaminoacyl peptidase
MSTLPYGSWPSPISADMLLADTTVGIGLPRVDGDDLYWLESRASDGGRSEVVRRRPDGSVDRLTPAPWNVRSRVHEYGGGSYGVAQGIVVFAHLADLRLYRLSPEDSAPVPITPEGVHRYAEPVIDVPRRLVYAIREDHTDPKAPLNTLVVLDLDGSNDDGGRTVFDGTDFVTALCLSPDRDRLAFVTWDLPKMPWEGGTVHVAELGEDGLPTSGRTVTDGSTWVQQPRFGPDRRLYWIEESGEWANLAAVDLDDEAATPQRFEVDGLEFGLPNWFLGTRTYDFLPDGRVVASAIDAGVARLVVADPADGSATILDSDVVGLDGLQVTGDGRVLCQASFRDTPGALVLLDVPDASSASPGVAVETLVLSSDIVVDAGTASLAELVTWQNGNGETVHGLYFPPANAEVSAPEDELPPLLVVTHGGPTGMQSPDFSLELHYWTSRGFAILDVNYGGSTGYGRSYRERLNRKWGVVDVEDSVSGALAMVEQGRADRARLGIRGGSAGGYTTLASLTQSDVFGAGASYYGIGDLESLAKETHKLESRYLDSMIGPYPEDREVYIERSPIHHLDQLSSPMILFQGTEDKAVPPNQATTMAEALRAKGLPGALIMFEGEGHGFRQAANLKRSLEAELSFYAQVFGFSLADSIDPVPIDNLPLR